MNFLQKTNKKYWRFDAPEVREYPRIACETFCYLLCVYKRKLWTRFPLGRWQRHTWNKPNVWNVELFITQTILLLGLYYFEGSHEGISVCVRTAVGAMMFRIAFHIAFLKCQCFTHFLYLIKSTCYRELSPYYKTDGNRTRYFEILGRNNETQNLKP